MQTRRALLVPSWIFARRARTALTRVRVEQLVQGVNLYLALGGSFGDPHSSAGDR